eukprot:scaffold1970_cov396-Prasinococcus_capsulatus_cf.AAC.26
MAVPVIIRRCGQQPATMAPSITSSVMAYSPGKISSDTHLACEVECCKAGNRSMQDAQVGIQRLGEAADDRDTDRECRIGAVNGHVVLTGQPKHLQAVVMPRQSAMRQPEPYLSKYRVCVDVPQGNIALSPEERLHVSDKALPVDAILLCPPCQHMPGSARSVATAYVHDERDEVHALLW